MKRHVKLIFLCFAFPEFCFLVTVGISMCIQLIAHVQVPINVLYNFRTEGRVREKNGYILGTKQN